VKAVVGGVYVETKILDGGRYYRCESCQHPYRVGRSEVSGPCRVCGMPRNNPVECSVDTYKRSREDDAPVPYTGP
jgi:hypothetical protein